MSINTENLNIGKEEIQRILEETKSLKKSMKKIEYNESYKSDKDIIFDYILRDGPCTTRNAIAILEYLGYPKDIYENARKGAKNYII